MASFKKPKDLAKPAAAPLSIAKKEKTQMKEDLGLGKYSLENFLESHSLQMICRLAAPTTRTMRRRTVARRAMRKTVAGKGHWKLNCRNFYDPIFYTSKKSSKSHRAKAGGIRHICPAVLDRSTQPHA